MIKTFESFKMTYSQIGNDEAIKLLSNDSDKKFTEIEIKSIKPFVPKNCSMGEFKTNINIVPQYDSIVSEIIIWKCPDEWYVIEISFMATTEYGDSHDGIYYKCDQIDGLSDFLSSRYIKNMMKQ